MTLYDSCNKQITQKVLAQIWLCQTSWFWLRYDTVRLLDSDSDITLSDFLILTKIWHCQTSLILSLHTTVHQHIPMLLLWETVVNLDHSVLKNILQTPPILKTPPLLKTSSERLHWCDVHFLFLLLLLPLSWGIP